MIAIISSTLIPTGMYSFFNEKERYDQTIVTIKKLQSLGFNDIYLFDNSIKEIDSAKIKNDSFSKLKIFQTSQYTFENKGLNEALLLLNNLQWLCSDQYILKISARYYPSDNFSINISESLNKYDVIGVGQNFDNKISFFSTRCYAVKNKKILEELLVLAVEEMISYSKGIHGFKSLWQNLFDNKIGTRYQLSLEQAFAKILKVKRNFLLLDKINLEGNVAGAQTLTYIQE